jgi:hypothetical protein
VVWETWKEKNSCIFNGRKWSPVEAWTLIHSHIKEKMGLKRWGSSDLRAGPEETMILRNWEICSIPKYVGIYEKGIEKGIVWKSRNSP